MENTELNVKLATIEANTKMNEIFKVFEDYGLSFYDGLAYLQSVMELMKDILKDETGT